MPLDEVDTNGSGVVADSMALDALILWQLDAL